MLMRRYEESFRLQDEYEELKKLIDIRDNLENRKKELLMNHKSIDELLCTYQTVVKEEKDYKVLMVRNYNDHLL